jgi:hypothetical protein
VHFLGMAGHGCGDLSNGDLDPSSAAGIPAEQQNRVALTGPPASPPDLSPLYGPWVDP